MNHQIPLSVLVQDILPRLQTCERLVNNTLCAIIEASGDPAVKAERRQQQERFSLELFRIRLDLEPLLERHADALRQLQKDASAKEGSERVVLNSQQEAAVEAVNTLYEQVRCFSRPAGRTTDRESRHDTQ